MEPSLFVYVPFVVTLLWMTHVRHMFTQIYGWRVPKNTLNLSTKIVVVLCCKMNSRLLVVYLSPSYFCRYRFYMDTSSLFLSLFWLCETLHKSSLDLISFAPFSRVLFCALFLSRVSIRVYDRRSLSPLNANRTRSGSNVKISCVENCSRFSN